MLNETLALRSFESTLHAGINTELERRDRLEQLKAERLGRGKTISVNDKIIISVVFILIAQKVNSAFPSCIWREY